MPTHAESRRMPYSAAEMYALIADVAAYPQFPEFLARKLEFDPDEVFQSDWYRHYRAMFADEISRSRSQ